MKWLLGAVISVTTAFVMLACCSCTDGGGAKLDAVNRLADVDNDSAIGILNTVDTTRLSYRQKAYYELLRMRFHYLDGGNPAFPDTLALWAQEEMLAEGKPDNVFEVYFWNSNVCMKQGRLISALLDAEMSRVVLPGTKYPEDDKIILEAHIDGMVANIWRLSGDMKLAMSYLRKAGEAYSKVKGSDYISGTQYNKMQIAEEMAYAGNALGAIALLDSVKPLNGDMERQLRRTRLLPLIKSGRIDDARGIVDGLLDEGMDSLPLMLPMAEIALHDGNLALARKYVDRFSADAAITLHGLELYVRIAEREGDLHSALEIQKKITELSGSYTPRISSVELKTALDSQNRRLMNESQLKARRNRDVTVMVIVLSLIAIISIIAGAAFIIRKRKAEKDNLVMEIEELRVHDFERDSKISRLLTQRFESMSRLCDEYFNLSDIKNENLAKNEIYKTLVAQLKEMGSEKFRKKLEESLNENMDGVMDRFRETFPGDRDGAALFLYFSSGFSAKAVGIFMGLKKSSVYTRRRNLRERIEHTDTPYKEKFLLLLN